MNTNDDSAGRAKGIIDELESKMAVDGKTLLQVDATAILGVLFFLSLTSYFPSALAALVTVSVLIPFAVSAAIILYPLTALIAVAIGTRTNPFDVEDRTSKAIGYAKTITMIGFFYLIFPIGYAISESLENPITVECAKNPESYGVNITHPWKCSLFTKGSLPELCVNNLQVFNMSQKECSGLIPPQNDDVNIGPPS
jgi:hypothetical protein